MTDPYIDLIHFNDVYHIEPNDIEPRGGASRFQTKLKQLHHQLTSTSSEDSKPILLFSGDAFNPSPLSTITRGWHMVPILNRFGIEGACYGNHDFDFGVPALEELNQACEFPWIISNLAINRDHPDTPLANAKQYIIITRGNIKVGIIGLVEKEWLLTISSLPDDYYYQDFIEVARNLSSKLRTEDKVDVVIALTHMRLPNDELLAQSCSDEIDLILGGHDHFYHIGSGCKLLNDKGEELDRISQSQDPNIPNLRVIKSDTDFRHLSSIRYFLKTKEVHVQRHVIGGDLSPDPEVEELVAKEQAQAGETLKVKIGYRMKPWDTRSETVRLKESEVGNLVADVLLYAHPNSDMTLICGGTLRSDTIYPAGPITVGDIMSILPFDDPVVMIAIKGQDLREGLEASLAEFPKQEGRFPQVAGIRLKFDPSASPNQRLREVKVRKRCHMSKEDRRNYSHTISHGKEGDQAEEYEPLKDDHIYRVVTRYYMAEGFDGFSPLKRGEYLVGEEEGSLISTFIRRYFLGMKYTALMVGATGGIDPTRAALATGRAWRYYTRLAREQPLPTESESTNPSSSTPSIATCLDASLLDPPPHTSSSPTPSPSYPHSPTHQPHHHPTTTHHPDRPLPLHLTPYITVNPTLQDRIVQLTTPHP